MGRKNSSPGDWREYQWLLLSSSEEYRKSYDELCRQGFFVNGELASAKKKAFEPVRKSFEDRWGITFPVDYRRSVTQGVSFSHTPAKLVGNVGLPPVLTIEVDMSYSDDAVIHEVGQILKLERLRNKALLKMSNRIGSFLSLSEKETSKAKLGLHDERRLHILSHRRRAKIYALKVFENLSIAAIAKRLDAKIEDVEKDLKLFRKSMREFGYLKIGAPKRRS